MSSDKDLESIAVRAQQRVAHLDAAQILLMCERTGYAIGHRTSWAHMRVLDSFVNWMHRAGIDAVELERRLNYAITAPSADQSAPESAP